MIGGRFQRSDRLGGDRTGEVWEAVDTHTGRPCVVKLVDPLVFPTPLLLQRAVRELGKLETVEAPTIARVLAHGREGDGEGQLWVAVERVNEARSLQREVTAKGPMHPVRAGALVCAIANGLSEAARVGVMHRDLSPKNALLDEHGAVKLINFCLPVPATPNVQGEPEFVAPELVEGKPVDQRTNIYSLGCIYYYLLTGQPPYVGDPQSVHQQHLQGQLRPPSALVQIPAEVEAAVLKALERQSSKRYMTLRQLLTEVERISAGTDAGSTQPMGAAGRAAAGKTIAFGALPADGGAAAAAQVPPPSGKDRRPAAHTMLGGFGAITDPAAGAAPAAGASAAQAPDTEPQVAAPLVPDDVPSGGGPVHQPPAAPVPDATPAPVAHEAVAPAQPQAPVVPAQPQAPVVPAQPQAPVVHQPAAPQPAAPRVSATADAPAGGKGKGPGKPRAQSESGANRGKFRETLWFKKGELDAVAAAEAAARDPQEGAADKADQLPIEDRYEDDGSLTAGDKQKFSLRTGHTQMMPAIADQPTGAGADVSEDDLIGEMKKGRGLILAIILAALVVIGGIVAWAVTGGEEEQKDEASESARPTPPEPPAAAPEQPAAAPEPPAPAPGQPTPAPGQPTPATP